MRRILFQKQRGLITSLLSNTPFEHIVLSLEKWFGVDIRFKNESEKDLNLSGTFEGENIDEILKAFQLTGKPFIYERDTNGVIWIK